MENFNIFEVFMVFYRKKTNNLKQRHFIHIYSNGYTEINYFNEKKIHGNKKNIKIEPFFENVGNPQKMMKIIEKKYNVKDLTSNDKIYCVIDVDDTPDAAIQEALRIKPEFINLILSNPNFELWLLLHFKLYTHQFSKEETVTKLKRYLPDYNKPEISPHFVKLSENEHIALSNTKKIKKFHNSNKTNLFTRSANPCTSVDEIVNQINTQ